MNTIPTPAALIASGRVKSTVTEQAAVHVNLMEPGTVVRPGFVAQEFTHDGILKTKNLRPGMKVRPFLDGAPRGGERTVKDVRRQAGGSTYIVEWVEGTYIHPETEHKAAYRWHNSALVGTAQVRHVRGFVEAH